MFALASIIFLLSPIAFLIGLFKPQWVLPGRNRTRRKSCLVYSAVFVTSVVVIAITAPPVPKQATAPSPTLQDSAPSTPAVTSSSSSSPSPTPIPSATPSTASPSPSFQPSPKPSISASPQVPDRISVNGAGLGDTRQNFEKIHGFNASNNKEFGRYENDYIHNSYADNTVMSVGLQFGKTLQARRTRKEALQAASTFLPSDAMKIKEWQSKPNEYAIHYESQKLAIAFPQKWQKVFWDDGVKPGSFLVQLTHEEENPESVFGVDIGAGDPNNP